MSTNARIGMVNPDGTITSIYTHWDGYPEHHAPILLEHYASEESLRALLALGDLSSLGSELGEKHDFDKHGSYAGGPAETDSWCLAYGRDREETDVQSRIHPAEEWPDYGQEYEYLYLPERTGYHGGQWRYREMSYQEDRSVDPPEYSRTWSDWKSLKLWNVETEQLTFKL